jgi:hypothetical protein
MNETSDFNTINLANQLYIQYDWLNCLANSSRYSEPSLQGLFRIIWIKILTYDLGLNIESQHPILRHSEHLSQDF